MDSGVSRFGNEDNSVIKEHESWKRCHFSWKNFAWMVDREDKEGGWMQEGMRWKRCSGKAIAFWRGRRIF